jgi:HAD superfamily hydrolase (TIGR01509 family)
MATSAAPRAIFFDLDSALVSRGLSLERFAERFAVDFADRLGGVSARGVAYGLTEVDGNGFRAHADLAAELRDLFPWRDQPSVEELTAYWDEVFPQCVAPDPEARATLRRLRARGIALGVVATDSPETQSAKIAALGLEGFFAAPMYAGETSAKKPDARAYQRVATALGIPPEAVWLVSALEEDCRFARDAGLGAIFLQRVFYWPAAAKPPTHEIATLSELVSLLGGEMD